MGGKNGCKAISLEPANISDILYLFGQANFIFIGEKSGLVLQEMGSFSVKKGTFFLAVFFQPAVGDM